MQCASYSKHLGLFPAESRVATGSYLSAVLQTQPGAMLTPSAWTVSTRQLHYLYFCRLMKWTNNWLLTGDEPELAMRGQLQLTMYAVHLATGNIIYCRRIKAATVEQHVMAAATFLAHFRKDLPTDSSMGHMLGPVYRDLRPYESVPERRKPYDIRMHALGRVLASSHDTNLLLSTSLNGWFQTWSLCWISPVRMGSARGEDVRRQASTQPPGWQSDVNPCYCPS